MSNITTSTPPTKEDVSLLASQLWESAGRPCGCDLEFWFRAEQLLLSKCSTAETSKPAQVKTAVPTGAITKPGKKKK